MQNNVNMDATAEPKTMRLKLIIDTHGKRVLFAEAGKDFVDFLFHVLSLPVATLVSLLKKQGNVGSLANLYDGVENLDDSYMQLKQTKEALLKPVPLSLVSDGPIVPKQFLTLNNNESPARKSYLCNHCYTRVSVDLNTTCPDCDVIMTRVLSHVGPTPDEIGFVKAMVTYMVMDDLTVKPLATMSSFDLLNKLDVKDISVVEEKVVDFGMDEAVKLLNASLRTNNVLTDVFLNCTSSKKRDVEGFFLSLA